ncbi:MAG TPA: hypothetical protein VNQ57_00930 [Ureibacillus sp.]|nr:hypothetical protein [Ureibacillus sp.]
MRKRFFLLLSVICLLSVTAACTDNGDETPVETKARVGEKNTLDLSKKINSMLKEM